MRKIMYLSAGLLLFSISNITSALTLSSSELTSLDTFYDLFKDRCKSWYIDIAYIIHDVEWIDSCEDITKLTTEEKKYLLRRIQENNVIISLRIEKMLQTSISAMSQNPTKTEITAEVVRLKKEQKEYNKYKKEYQKHLQHLQIVPTSPDQIKEIDVTKDHLQWLNRIIKDKLRTIGQYTLSLKSR